MHRRKGKKILIYFLLLLTVGSINNSSLNKLKFKRIVDINIAGLGSYYNAILLQEINSLNLKNIFFINNKEIINKINSNTLVERYEIFKRYPSSLNIKIDKTKFLARMNNNGKVFLVGANGKFSEKNFFNNKLPFIFGKPKVEEFLNFKKIIDQSKFSYDMIKNLYFFPSMRWDVELNDNKIIKLSKNHPKHSLDFAFEFLHNQSFENIKIIDARVKNQIILND